MRLSLPILILGTTSLVMAADPETYRGSGYGFFTAGRCQHGYTILGGGGGAEGFLWKGLTLGAEGGYQKFINDVGFGDFYLPVGYHFVDRKRLDPKLDPFVSVSVLGVFAGRGGYGGAGHIGGGVTYWFKKRIGVRMEFRAHVFAGEEVTGQARVGITFR